MAVVVAVALVPVAVAYLQLGFGGAAVVDRPAVDAVDRAVERSVAAVASTVAGEYSWTAREDAAEAVRDRLEPRFAANARTPGDGTVAVRLSFNQTVAQRVASGDCPRGAGRQFGGCIADGGVVLQQRAGDAVLVGVAVDIAITGPDGTTSLTRHYRVVGSD